MEPPAAALSYESRISSALQAGEAVLWERRPIAPEPIPIVAGCAAIVLIIAGVTGFAHLFSGDMVATTVSAVIASVVVLVAGALALNDALARRRKHSRSIYRITNRRVMRIDDKPPARCDELAAADLAEFEMRRREHETRARFSSPSENGEQQSVDFRGLESGQPIESLIMSQWAASGRRGLVRRMSHALPSETSMMPVSTPCAAPLPEGLALHRAEIVLWSGKPQRWRADERFIVREAGLVAMMTIPAAILLAPTGLFGPYVASMPGWLIACSFVWLLLSLTNVLIKPFRDAQRLRRTTYVLTNSRAIIYEHGRTRTTHSFLLDIAKDAFLRESRDGTGDIVISVGATFERVENAQQVYALVLAAINSSGRMIEQPDPAPPIVSRAASS